MSRCCNELHLNAGGFDLLSVLIINVRIYCGVTAKHIGDVQINVLAKSLLFDIAAYLGACQLSRLVSTGDVIKALRQYFGYSKQPHKEKKSDYSNAEWSALLMKPLKRQLK